MRDWIFFSDSLCYSSRQQERFHIGVEDPDFRFDGQVRWRQNVLERKGVNALPILKFTLESAPPPPPPPLHPTPSSFFVNIAT